MANSLRNLIASVLCLVICFTQVLPASCCGPFFPYAVYVFPNHPDLPLRKYAQGQIGIVQSSLARSYLFVAYRYFINEPLDPAEQEAVLSLWHARLAEWTDLNSQPWLTIRATVPGVKKIDNYALQEFASFPGKYDQFKNLNDSALLTAAETLKARIAKYGKASPQVKLWVQNQDAVFQNTGGEKNGSVTLPKDPGAKADALCRADFDYQTAAANLYACKFITAYEQFKKITADKQSPWHKLAAYLMARSAVSPMTLYGSAEHPTAEWKLPDPEETISYIRNLKTNPDFAEYKDDCQLLLNALNCQGDQEAECQRLAKELLRPHTGAMLKHNLDDYTCLLNSLYTASKLTVNPPAESRNYVDSLTETDTTDNKAEKTEPATELSAAVLKDDLTAWLDKFGATEGEGKAFAIEKWNQTKSMPWLIAALCACKPDDPLANKLLEAASKVSINSPAYLSTQYYAILLQIAMNQQDKARKQLDYLLTEKIPGMTPSARNLLAVARQKTTQNLAESLSYGLKQPSDEVSMPSYRSLPDDFDKREKTSTFKTMQATFDSSMANALNDTLPLSLWKQLAYNKQLAPRIHGEVVSVAWMRAILLGDTAMALELSPMFAASYPSLKPMIVAFQNAQTKDERQFAACYVMLKAPGLSPMLRGDLGRVVQDVRDRDDYGDNFWTPVDPDEKKKSDEIVYPNWQGTEDPGVTRVDLNRYMTAGEKASTLSEKRILFKQASPPRFITESVFAWAKSSPKDPRLPEALFRAIKMPRWGCRATDSSKYSKAAYVLLHAKYPTTSWANKAEYYY